MASERKWPLGVTHSLASKVSVITSADTVLRVFVQFAFSIFLARLLAPADFGVLAMLQVSIGIATVLADGGLASALIQRKVTSQLEESSVFHFNALVGLAMFLLLCALAPALEAFFAHPGLASIAMVVASTVFLNSLGSIHGALLTRELNAGLQMKIAMGSMLASGALALVLARLGFGVWALVAQTVAVSVLSVGMLWAFHRWRPSAEFSWSTLRPLLAYGSPLMAAGLLDVGFGRLYTLLIGRQQDAATLGLYSRAVATQQLPDLLLRRVVGRVAFPMMSARVEDKERLLATTRSLVQTSMFLYFPCVVGLGVTAERLMPVVFGPQWAPSAPILQILVLGAFAYPLSSVNLTLLKAHGMSGSFLRFELIKKAILLGLVLLAAPHGVLAIAGAYSAAAIAALFVNCSLSSRLIRYGLGRQLRDCSGILLSGLVMGAAAWWIGGMQVWSDKVTLLVQCVVGVLVYVSGCLMLRSVPAGARDLLGFLRTMHRH